MKLFSFFKIGLLVSVVIFICLLLVMEDADTRSLSRKIRHYDAVADSLRTMVETLHVNLHQKDSMLLVYLASLDITIEELNKESFRNRSAIRQNLLKQDSIRAIYCQQMFELNQQPDECHCD